MRWRRIDLKRVIAERFGVDFHPRYVGKLLKKLGFSHMSARPRHPAQDERIVEAFKNFPRALKAHLEGLPKTTPVEIWFEDEARIGQKNGLARQWARRGTRPSSPPTSAMTTPICSAQSAPPAASGRPSRCLFRHRHDATSPRQNLAHGRRGRALLCSSTGPDGTRRASSTCPTTSRRSSCLPAPRS